MSGGSGSLRVAVMTRLDEQAIRRQLARDEFLWLDLTAPSDAEVNQLGALLGLHPLAVEDVLHGAQRPKLDEYGDYVFLVFYAAQDRRPEEVHLFVSGGYLVTIHREPLGVLDAEREQLARRSVASEQFVVYHVIDALTDSFFPALAAIDDDIDTLQEAVVADPGEEQLRRMFSLRRELVTLRKVITPQRDIFARSIDRIGELPGLTVEQRDYFRDVYDHLIRASDMVDAYRDLLSGAMDLYLSTISNRQNEVMKQLAVVGTIFLPLSFITGFFGQNFGWLVGRVLTPLWAFLAFGIGSLVVTCVLLLAFFRRRGWL